MPAQLEGLLKELAAARCVLASARPLTAGSWKQPGGITRAGVLLAQPGMAACVSAALGLLNRLRRVPRTVQRTDTAVGMPCASGAVTAQGLSRLSACPVCPGAQAARPLWSVLGSEQLHESMPPMSCVQQAHRHGPSAGSRPNAPETGRPARARASRALPPPNHRVWGPDRLALAGFPSPTSHAAAGRRAKLVLAGARPQAARGRQGPHSRRALARGLGPLADTQRGAGWCGPGPAQPRQLRRHRPPRV